jgi:hypothetical protein
VIPILLLSLLGTVLATAGALYALSRLPEDFLIRPVPVIVREGPGDWARLIARNVAGAMALVVGVLLSLPGVPGPGVATMLLGFLLLDFPGKRRLESRLLSRPHLLAAVNSLRRHLHRPPLVPPHPHAPADAASAASLLAEPSPAEPALAEPTLAQPEPAPPDAAQPVRASSDPPPSNPSCAGDP